jgi:hypothetical protein
MSTMLLSEAFIDVDVMKWATHTLAFKENTKKAFPKQIAPVHLLKIIKVLIFL